ncbi:MAG: hypothetical protein GY862_20475, partial [Gammaproteobacteria bacterium]|nr:hypothetical protein [Gammaproteobacteria bacterium]
MNKVKPKPVFLYCCLALIMSGVFLSAQPGYAQSFDLFDPERGKAKPVPKKPLKKPATPKKTTPKQKLPKRKKPLPRQNNFILRGTARMGKKFSVVLQIPPNGKKVFLRWQPGSQTPVSSPVKGYEKFILRNVKPRMVELIYPPKSPCRKSDHKKGLKCSEDGKIGTLTLNRARPTPQKR